MQSLTIYQLENLQTFKIVIVTTTRSSYCFQNVFKQVHFQMTVVEVVLVVSCSNSNRGSMTDR